MYYALTCGVCYAIVRGMAKERTFSDALNLRVDPAMTAEIRRIGAQYDQTDSETARKLIEYGIEAHRAREAAMLQLPYNEHCRETPAGDPMILRISAEWIPVDLSDEY